MEKQPINEMGVIALFCVIFNYMRKPFKIGENTLEFRSIKYVQSPFPDACINCKIKDRNHSNTELKAEFEYQSFNYILHKHHKHKNVCDMIICWEDNAKNDEDRSKKEVVKAMPPILELKNFLETGEINLK
jgi:hypothetical protein